MTIYKFFTEQSSFARLSKLFIFPLFLSASLLTTAVQAAPSAPLAAIERQNQLIQNQQQERLREDQQRALGERPAPGGTNLNNIKPRVASPDIGVQCRNISRIEITGDEKMIPAKLLAKVRHDYTGRCISVSDIESLLGLLTKDFIDRGFITTRVYLPVQDLRTGSVSGFPGSPPPPPGGASVFPPLPPPEKGTRLHPPVILMATLPSG